MAPKSLYSELMLPPSLSIVTVSSGSLLLIAAQAHDAFSFFARLLR